MQEIKKQPVINKRNPNSHKGNYGRVFIVAGSPGMTGAAYMCGKSALRSGAGLVTVGIPESLNPVMEVKLTCVMTLPLPETPSGTIAGAAKIKIQNFSEQCDVIVIGPGLSQHPETRALVIDLIKEVKIPIVLDADGLNAIQGELSLLKNINQDIILTPHPGELARLMNRTSSDIQCNRRDVAEEFITTVKQHNINETCDKEKDIVLVLKGNKTVVINHSNIYINNTGNPGMASGGSGDVLSGIIGALIAQGFTPFSASQLAVYIHGRAGDLAAKQKGETSMIATDIIDYLSNVFIELTTAETALSGMQSMKGGSNKKNKK